MRLNDFFLQVKMTTKKNKTPTGSSSTSGYTKCYKFAYKLLRNHWLSMFENTFHLF